MYGITLIADLVYTETGITWDIYIFIIAFIYVTTQSSQTPYICLVNGSLRLVFIIFFAENTIS